MKRQSFVKSIKCMGCNSHEGVSVAAIAVAELPREWVKDVPGGGGGGEGSPPAFLGGLLSPSAML